MTDSFVDTIAEALWNSQLIICSLGPQERRHITWEQAIERNLTDVEIFRHFVNVVLEAMLCPPKEIIAPFYKMVDDPNISAFDAWNEAISTAMKG